MNKSVIGNGQLFGYFWRCIMASDSFAKAYVAD